MKVLIIDNYDSFTFNLYQYVGEILSTKSLIEEGFKFDLIVKRNDEITVAEIKTLAPDRIIISPGPGSPDDASYFGVCAQTIRELGAVIPLLGVCLGMQGIVHVFGGNIVRAQLPMHGKLSPIVHNGAGLFRDVPQGLDIMRYHSLIAEPASFPDCLEITAYIQTQDNEVFQSKTINDLAGTEIMGVKHRQYPIQGIQFHPESFASEGGKEMIENFLF